MRGTEDAKIAEFFPVRLGSRAGGNRWGLGWSCGRFCWSYGQLYWSCGGRRQRRWSGSGCTLQRIGSTAGDEGQLVAGQCRREGEFGSVRGESSRQALLGGGGLGRELVVSQGNGSNVAAVGLGQINGHLAIGESAGE